jgi:uncharacterized membrane protein
VSDEKRPSRWSTYAGLLAVLALAAVIRSVGIHHQSYTMDEITEMRIAQLPVNEIIVRTDGFPPLYHLLLKSWFAAWHRVDVARWMSVALGLLSVLAVYWLGTELGGPRIGVVAAGLIAVSPMHVWFAQEARAYALTLPLAAIAFWLFARAMRTNALRDWLCYVVVAAAGLYTHYYFSLLVAFNALWVLLSFGFRPALRPAFVAHLVLLVLAAPVLVLLRGDLAFQSGTLLSPFALGDFFYTFYAFLLGFSTGLSLRELHGARLADAVPVFLPWVLALATCVVLLVPALWRGFRDRKRSLVYLILMIVGPVVLCALLSSLLHVKYKVSYALWASIPLVLILAPGVAGARDRRAPRLALLMYLVMAATSLANRHMVDRYQNEDIRALSAYLNERSTPEVPILVISGYMAEPVRFYLGPDWSVQGLFNGDDTEASRIALSEHSRGPSWFVYTRPFHGDPHGWVHDYLTRNSAIHFEAGFPGIELFKAGGQGRLHADNQS